MPDLLPIDRRVFDAGALMAQHAPQWRDANKRIVFEIGSPMGSAHRGTIGYTRWAAIALPDRLEAEGGANTVGLPGYFDYHAANNAEAGIDWHLNFADPHLFAAYGSALFAQDEMQVTEHPALGALRDALTASGLSSMTVESGRPTPILITGVERRVVVATDPDPRAGRAAGLYGNAFSRAEESVIRQATKRIEPPTISNIIAIAAARPGRGTYRRSEIDEILTTAYSGFRAAVLESATLRGHSSDVAIYTGYWGCGAFGGNRVLMALLQVIAARLAGIDRLVFHTGPAGGEAALAQALAMFDALVAKQDAEVVALIEVIHGYGFEWGISDGN